HIFVACPKLTFLQSRAPMHLRIHAKGTCVDGAASRIPVPAPDCTARTLKTACREVRDLARFPQSSRAVTQKRIGASTGLRVAAPSTQMPLGLMFAALAVVSCGSAPKSDRVQATYDKQTGKLVQLTVDAKKDGKPDIYSYMDGTKFVRIEIDNDEDGKIDRWEYYGPDQKLEKVGFSRANDGKPDAWAYQAPDGSIGRVEISTRR